MDRLTKSRIQPFHQNIYPGWFLNMKTTKLLTFSFGNEATIVDDVRSQTLPGPPDPKETRNFPSELQDIAGPNISAQKHDK